MMLVQVDAGAQQRAQFLSANSNIDLANGTEVNAHEEVYVTLAISVAAGIGTKQANFSHGLRTKIFGD
jgi:hypothetical protein